MKIPLPGRLPAVVAFVAVAIMLAMSSSSGAAAHAGGARCRDHQFPVRVTAFGNTELTVFGQLCVRGRPTAQTPVQVLLHGGTYDHTYWDWPQQPRKYSYIYHATRAGFVTVNLDRLGYGRSSRPDPTVLDFAVGAQAVHQVIEQLRGGVMGPRFTTIVLNGHSMGGLVAQRAARLGGVDAVIISGIPARRGQGDLSGSDQSAPTDDLYPFYPAEQDPKFAGRPWPAGYLTTRPGTRAEAFHFPGTYDPAILPFEERWKDTLTIAELRTVRSAAEQPGVGSIVSAIAVPTAYVLGRHDIIACRTTDCATDPAAAGADQIVPGSGHSMNVSNGALSFYNWTFDWLAGQGIHPHRR